MACKKVNLKLSVCNPSPCTLAYGSRYLSTCMKEYILEVYDNSVVHLCGSCLIAAVAIDCCGHELLRSLLSAHFVESGHAEPNGYNGYDGEVASIVTINSGCA